MVYRSLIVLVYLSSLFPASASTSNEGSIDRAIARGDLAEVERQLAQFPERAKQGEHPGLKPLHQAILRKQSAIATVLIAKGADLNLPDPSEGTPLHLAVERNLPQLVELLLASGALPNQLDKTGWTPLHWACARNQLELVELLLEGGADPRVRSRRGGTPLHEAAVGGSVALVQRLLEAGVDPAVRAQDGSTAYSLALKADNQAVLPLLKVEQASAARSSEL